MDVTSLRVRAVQAKHMKGAVALYALLSGALAPGKGPRQLARCET